MSWQCYGTGYHIRGESYIAVVLDAVLPEVPHREFSPDRNRGPEHHHHANANNTAGRMVQRQRIVYYRFVELADVVQIIHSCGVKVEPATNAKTKARLALRKMTSVQADRNECLCEKNDNIYLECLTTAALGRPVVPDV